MPFTATRSEEHTSELQSLAYLVCRLLLEKKKNESKNPRAAFAALCPHLPARAALPARHSARRRSARVNHRAASTVDAASFFFLRRPRPPQLLPLLPPPPLFL